MKHSRKNRWSLSTGFLALVVLAGLLPSGVAGFSGATGGGGATSATAGQYSPPVWFPLRRNITGGDIKIGCTYLSYGTEGGYECAGHHPFWALDLLAGTGTEIYPAGAGYAKDVTGVGYSGYGNVVVVDHGNGVKSLYSHMSQVLVSRTGAWVDTNTVIGLVGSTGDSSTPHLLFEVSSSGSFSAGARDPGALQVCHGSQYSTYPQAWGLTSWKGIPWGTHTGYSDGTGCSPPAPTALVVDPATRQYLGFLGLLGTKVVYSAHLSSPAGGPADPGATVSITAPGNQACSAVTGATGGATCSVTYGLLSDPPDPSAFQAAFAGDATHLPSLAVGSMP